MVLILYIIGVIVFIASVVAGFLSGSFIGFIAFVCGGISTAIIFLALRKILENQQAILDKIQYHGDMSKKLQNQKKKTCTKCNYKYDFDYNSCPHCGKRD